MADDYNPWIAAGVDAASSEPNHPCKGGADSIEPICGLPNVTWQTRARPPSDFENRLADGLQALFERGVTELADIVAGLNELGIEHPDGGSWRQDNYAPAMQALAALATHSEPG